MTVEARALAPAPHNSDVSFGRFGQHTALLVDGVVQSIAFGASIQHTTLYWPLMLPLSKPRRALLLGVGGGTLANLLLERWPDLHIVGVDNDHAVIKTARRAGWLPPGMQVFRMDAAEFVRMRETRTDYIAVDLYNGANIAPCVYEDAFLSHLRRIASGSVVFNLFGTEQLSTRLHTIVEHFSIDRVHASGTNLILHCS